MKQETLRLQEATMARRTGESGDLTLANGSRAQCVRTTVRTEMPGTTSHMTKPDRVPFPCGA
jgi:hypothetical protein